MSVKCGKDRRSYYLQGGTNHDLLHFHGTDASIASMFVLKFMDYIVTSNIKEAMYAQNLLYQ